MKLRKLSAIMMAAVVATSTPAGAVLGQITAYADSDKDKSKDYNIGGADWDVQEDANGKIHIFATWDASDDSCGATITVTRDDKKTGISVTTTTTKGSVELTQQIKKYNKTGDYTFKIKAKKKSTGESEVAESESDFYEIDEDTMKKLSSTAATSSGVNTNNGQTPGSSIPIPGTSTTPATPNAAPAGTSTAATQSTDTSGDFLTNGTITDWGIGHVYLVNGAPVFSKWIVDSGKLYHIGANGFMDKNLTFSDYTGTHYVGADGALVY